MGWVSCWSFGVVDEGAIINLLIMVVHDDKNEGATVREWVWGDCGLSSWRRWEERSMDRANHKSYWLFLINFRSCFCWFEVAFNWFSCCFVLWYWYWAFTMFVTSYKLIKCNFEILSSKLSLWLQIWLLELQNCLSNAISVFLWFLLFF